MADERLPQAERKAVFLALVQAQDAGMDAAKSREAIAGRFAISQEQVRAILDGTPTFSGAVETRLLAEAVRAAREVRP